MGLQIETRSLGDTVVLDCRGKIVMGEDLDLLRQKVKSILTQTRQIVINLQNVSYIDSTGVGALVGMFTSARTAGGTVKLAGVARHVKDVLQITKLTMIFETYETAQEAAESFNREAGKTAAS